MPDNRLIDVHCHIFNARQLTREFLVLLTIRFFKMLDRHREEGIKSISIKDKCAALIRSIKTIANFFRILFKASSKDIYQEYKGYYGQDIIIAPLMMDVLYGVYNPEGVKGGAEALAGETGFNDIYNLFRDRITLLKTELADMEKQITAFTGEGVKGGDAAVSIEALKAELETALGGLDRIVAGTAVKGIPSADSGFDLQVKELEALKKEYPDSVFPFLAVDPRRPGIINLVKEKVIDQRLFTGIKIYPSLGYLPGDPVLMEIFGLCKDQIPVTAHTSPVFITTLVNSVRMRGYMLTELAEKLPVQKTLKHTVIDGIALTQVDEIIGLPPLDKRDPVKSLKERSRFLADPHHWLPVLEKYPDLRLNLAHFGGDDFLDYFTPATKERSWTNKIIPLLKKYPNVYTDFSFFDKEEEVKQLSGLIEEDEAICSKIMYGSDFIVLMTSVLDFSRYSTPIRTIMEKHFNRLAGENPRKFLGLETAASGKGNTAPVRARKEAPATPDDNAGRYAVIVGIQNYREAYLQNLRLTVNDARDMERVLREKGFFRTRLLTDEDREMPTRDNIIASVKHALKLLEEDALKTFVFYFSGHGGSINDVNYLMPLDGGMKDLAELEKTGINLNELLTMIKPISEKAKAMLFLDACRKNPSFRSAMTLGKNMSHTWKDLKSHGIKIIYSAQPNKYSYELSGLGHKNSLFTGYLLQALQGDPAVVDNRGCICFNKVYEYVYEKMEEFSAQYKDYPQIPRMAMPEEGEGVDYVLTLASP